MSTKLTPFFTESERARLREALTAHQRRVEVEKEAEALRRATLTPTERRRVRTQFEVSSARDRALLMALHWDRLAELGIRAECALYLDGSLLT